ncbi:MAG TPA: thioredoxin [Acidimicrobiales bacterium]|nr:thioredoxin [Acidimicrobiales bacterium]
MPTIELTKDNLEGTLQNNAIVFIDFWAAWCGPCRTFAPIFEAAAERNPDIVFGKVDTEAQQELAAAFNVMSIPTLTIFKEGIGVFSQPGALPTQVLDDLVGKVRELDMDEVRAALQD